jgi:uncharacterized repeat protein (TIGR03806 family)
MARCLLMSFCCLILGATAAPAEEGDASFGLESRIAWTSSRLIGSPEPPLPYTVEKTFTNVTFKDPLYVADEPGSNYLWVVSRGGEVDRPSRIGRLLDDPAAKALEPRLELPRRLIYSVCFDPDYARNRAIYLFTNGPTSEPERTNRISRFTVARGSSPRVDPKSEQVLIEWRSAGHDGGDMAFGLDGMFYITTGDGSSDSDEWNTGQTLDDLQGAVLRIDVRHRGDHRPYRVPPDNPFVNTPAARPEIWAYGLRNPWRMSIDPRRGHVWVGNNGQDLWETAHLVRRGENYGWSVYEGGHSFYLERKLGPTPHVPPTIEHSHAEFRSLTGGVVYYGDKLPDLNGAYIYGDFSSGRIWGMHHDGQRVVWHRELADTRLQIVAFRVDQRGELLVVDLGGGLYRLVPTPSGESQPPFPVRLSETGLFASTNDHRAACGLIPYSVNVPSWADGAEGERFIALPGESRVDYHSDRSWEFPDGTALVQTLTLQREPGDASSRVRVETRVLLRQQGEWAGYSYRWNDDQSDALLVEKEGAETTFAIHDAPQDDPRRQTWRFPSRSECMACHSRAANYVLGLSEAQLNRDHDYSTVRDNQLRTLEHVGVFASALPTPPKDAARLVDLDDQSQDLETRARAYLQVNCSVCHVSAGGGNSKMELLSTTPREKMNLVGARPQHDTFGIVDAMLVAPGDPQRSVLVHRLDRRGRGQMPPLVTNRADPRAVKLMRDWIAGLKPEKPFVRAWQMEDLLPALEEAKAGRPGDSGKSVFRETGCVQCHRFGGEGGTVGPDLTGIGKRLAARELLESVLLPSKVIADEYATYLIETTHGEVVSGRIEREDGQVLVLRSASAVEAPVEIAKQDILDRKRSDTSNMPAGMVNVLEKEQILDLLAYLHSSQDVRAVSLVERPSPGVVEPPGSTSGYRPKQWWLLRLRQAANYRHNGASGRRTLRRFWTY